MIFSKLFKSKKKWQSDKVSDRIIAIAELDTKQDKSIFHELAFNDGNEKVRRAALEKLNEFSLWWQAYKTDHNEQIKKLAERILVASIKGEQDSNLDNSLKTQFIQQCNKTQLLEQVIFDLNDDELTLATLERLQKWPLSLKAIEHNNVSIEVKQALLAKVDDKNTLKKLAKKLPESLANQAQQQLEQLQLAAEKPIKVEKDARLLLAQLNALKDKTDYELILSSQQHIDESWQQSASEFDCLADDVTNELTTKYQQINDSLERICTPLKNAWQEQQDQALKQQQQQQTLADLNQALTAIESQVTDAVSNDKELDLAHIEQQLSELTLKVQQSELPEAQAGELNNNIKTLLTRAGKVPEIKAAVDKAQQLLNQYQELTLPSDLESLLTVQSQYHELQYQWRALTKELNIGLPTAINQGYQTLQQTWQPVIKELQDQQFQLFNNFKRKLAELGRLIASGKYRSAFGLFTKLQAWSSQLSDKQLQQTSRKWLQMQEQVEELKGLQAEINVPKIDELLTNIAQLAESPLADPTEQAYRVKMARSNWNALGSVTDEQQQQFNELSEKAFSTCRTHYQQLEKQRADHLADKQLILQQLSTLADNLSSQQVTSWPDVDALFTKLTKLWRETGQIDREHLDQVNEQYQLVCAPIKQALKQYYQDNQKQKESFIRKAETIAQSDDNAFEKVAQLKSLQQQWKKVGFAGRNIDQKLWTKFRAINNPVFAERDKQSDIQSAQANEKFDQLQNQLSELKAKLSDSSELADIRQLQEQVSELSQDNGELNKKQKEQFAKAIKSLTNDIQTSLSNKRQQQEQQQYVDLFSAVADMASGKPTDLTKLKSNWQTALNQQNKQSRKELTLQLEIIAGVDSPEEDKALRNETQVALMTQKLEQGTVFNNDELLEMWLSAGHFDSDDEPLLTRIKPIFLG